MNWDDLRFVLGVVDHGSVGAAARALGVNHATVLRRIAAFEEAAGAPVFERHAQGYRLRPDRVAMVEAAREAAQALDRAARMMRPETAEGGRVLRLTSVDTLCTTVLATEHGRIARRIAPHRLEIVSSNQRLDLARLQADVCVRPAPALPDSMIGRRSGEIGFAVYAAPGGDDAWLGFAGPLSASLAAETMQQLAQGQPPVAHADSFLVLRALAEAGRGRALLPCILGDNRPGLERLPDPMPMPITPVWVGCHRDLAGIRMIETLIEAVAAALRAQGGPMRGQG
ncbi:LysR family transcriptional regulator [Thetidibacter halocola]|uniref:LysR family transcriptional regulator n=1 Tax=Thetidibacter halocola TaxID=2827239 RepID=UPI0031FE8861